MPVITFANTKGGAGKTTSLFVLASELVNRGNRVTIVDADPRRWLTRWYGIVDCGPNLFAASADEHTIEDTVSRLRKRGGYTLIDLPSTHDALLAKAIGLADHVLIPVQGCAMDAAGGGEVLELLQALESECNIRIPHSVVLTRVNSAVTTRSLLAARELLSSHRIPTLDVPLAERAAYRDAFVKGGLLHQLQSHEVSNLDRAIDNARRFADDVLKQMPKEVRVPVSQQRRPAQKAADAA